MLHWYMPTQIAGTPRLKAGKAQHFLAFRRNSAILWIESGPGLAKNKFTPVKDDAWRWRFWGLVYVRDCTDRSRLV